MSDEHAGGRTFVRFSVGQRIEHMIQTVAFLMLCVTGVPQRFNGAGWADSAILAMGGVDVVRGIHRTFGVVLIASAVYHAVALAYALFVQRVRWTMIPSLKDGKDAIQMILYFIGVRKEPARFDRFDFRQKVEYLALIWGTLVMIASGLCLWFPIRVTQYVSGEMIAAAKAAHGGEGLLALGSILLWHMYSAHLSPTSSPST